MVSRMVFSEVVCILSEFQNFQEAHKVLFCCQRKVANIDVEQKKKLWENRVKLWSFRDWKRSSEPLDVS